MFSHQLDKTRGGKWFTRLDLKNGYNLIRIAAGDKWKTAIHTKQGLFEYIVMAFVLTNAPATFQEMRDTIFKDMEGCIWNLDNILIYGGDTKAEHQAIVEKVLQQCAEHGLAVDLLKSEFHVNEIIFLVHVIHSQDGKMDPSKLETMSKWPILTMKNKVQAFLAFTNYYRRFIVNYSAKAHLFIDVTKYVPFSWEIHNSKPSTNSERDSSHLQTLPNSIEPSRQLWKLILAISNCWYLIPIPRCQRMQTASSSLVPRKNPLRHTMQLANP